MSILKKVIEEMSCDSCGSAASMNTYLKHRVQAENEEVSRHSGLVKFFKENPKPTDDEIHGLAEEIGIEHSELEERIYKLLSSVLKGVGKNNDTPDEEFDQEQLSMGIGVEMEHTEDELIAKMIAKDHLAEIPDYYSRLGKMEKEAGAEHHDGESDEISFNVGV